MLFLPLKPRALKPYFLFILLFFQSFAFSQKPDAPGVISGSVIADATGKQVVGATVKGINISITGHPEANTVTDEDGGFTLNNLVAGYYRLSITAINFTALDIDSIYLRKERMDFNLDDIRLAVAGKELSTVVIYAEKPLFEDKDGKLTFNVGESALAAASSTTELLKQTPLVSVDEDGKILMKGKEVKILIDDKPVELDARQLQDLLESMPGSMIEKIEVLTTPPSQYANERGGVINIVTKKGKIGKSGRLNINYGTRGQAGASGSLFYRKRGLAINLSAGYSYNRYNSESFSNRKNIYADSSNFFNTTGESFSENGRPNARLNVDYDYNKQNSLSFTANFNAGDNEGNTVTGYSNLNQYDVLFKRSNRNIASSSNSNNSSASISYTLKTKTAGEILRINANTNFGSSDAFRTFFQQYLRPDSLTVFADSAQRQVTHVKSNTQSLRLSYDKPLPGKKWQISTGANVLKSSSENILHTLYVKKPEGEWMENPALSNAFKFVQNVYSLRAAIRYNFTANLYSNAGVQQEFSQTYFRFVDSDSNYRNDYNNLLPFWNITQKWDSGYTLTLSYKRSIQRPGLRQLNPSIDYGDPFNLRFGNPYLLPYFSDNIDITAGYFEKKYNFSLSVGFNTLRNIYTSIRTLQADGKTYTTWQNLSGRKEYEVAAWGGLRITSLLKVNGSASYVYNVYSEQDKIVKRYHDGGSLTSSLTSNFQWTTMRNISANFTYNRFATPQGSARSNLSMNIGVQQKFLKKALSVNLNVVDPFKQQASKYFIDAPNYLLESYSSTKSRSLRIAVSYNFKKKPKKVPPRK